MLKPLNAVEWLEAERITGNQYAPELLDLLDGEEEADSNADAIDDLKRLVPNEIANSSDLWRTVEWITDRLALLDEVEATAEEFGGNMTWPNGSKPDDLADKLRAMFESEHWLEHDL